MVNQFEISVPKETKNVIQNAPICYGRRLGYLLMFGGYSPVFGKFRGIKADNLKSKSVEEIVAETNC